MTTASEISGIRSADGFREQRAVKSRRAGFPDEVSRQHATRLVLVQHRHDLCLHKSAYALTDRPELLGQQTSHLNSSFLSGVMTNPSFSK